MVSIASNDMIVLERGFQMMAIMFAGPVLSIFTFILIGILIDYIAAIIVCILYIVTILA